MTGDHRCMLSVAVVLAMLAKPPEFFLSLKERLAVTPMPCNGSTVRKSPRLQGSDLQILILLSSWQRPGKATSCQVSHPKIFPPVAPMTDMNHMARHGRAVLLGLWDSQHHRSVGGRFRKTPLHSSAEMCWEHIQ